MSTQQKNRMSLQLVHDQKELIKLSRLQALNEKIRRVIDEAVASELGYYVSDIQQQLRNNQKKISGELAKYYSLVGRRGVRIRRPGTVNPPRAGKVEAITHFTTNDVVVTFKYDDGGIETGVQLGEIEEGGE